ncbi:MAG: AEC family transporter [Proteobacteria bacterium]|nr:AEC family transporter [Pseudomonadota bacterium]
MGTILGVTIPAFLAILLGRALADRGFVPADFWSNIQRLSYFVFLPLLIVHTLATADFSEFQVVGLVLTIIVTLVAGGGAVWLWRRWSGERPEMTLSLGEGAVRANIPLGLAIAFALSGQAGLTLFVLATVVYLPTVVILGAYLSDHTQAELREAGLSPEPGPRQAQDSSEATTGATPGASTEANTTTSGEPSTVSGDGGAPPQTGPYAGGWEGTLRRALSVLIRDPIVIGAIVGIILNATGVGLASGLGGVIQMLGFAAIPAGLLATGAAIDIDKLRDAYEEFRGEIRIALILKLIAMPVIALVIGAIFGLGGITAATVILLAALPNVIPRFTAQAPDASQDLLLPGITAASTIAAFVSVPLALWILT